MICKNCGMQINENSKFCTECGAPVEEQISKQEQQPRQFAPQTQKAQQAAQQTTRQIEEKLKQIATDKNKDKFKTILEKIKVFFKVRFVKFLKNYKNFKKLPKQSKIKHILFPIIVVLVVSLCTNFGGGSTKGLNNSEANAVLACSMLPSSVSSAVSIGAVDQVYFGSLSEYYKIISTEKKKTSEGYEITVNLEYDTYGHIATNKGTLIFKYNKESKTAKLIGGSALNDLQFIAEQYAFN